MNICVYGASSSAIDKDYIAKTEELGRKITQRGHKLVYGAGAQGLMGAVARGVREKDGYIIGVSPSYFNVDGILYDGCDEMIYTETMRERKQIMEDNSDAFIMTPGGMGTFEEFFEILTLKQVGRHKKPIAVFNIGGYYDAMEAMIQNAIKGNFMTEACGQLYKSFTDIDEMIEYLETYEGELAEIQKMKDI